MATVQDMPEGMVPWLQSGLQAQEGINNAIGQFSMAVDKEIAAKAAYKALGLDPRDAPTYGWNMMERPRVQVVNQTQNSMPWIGATLLALAIAAGAGVAYFSHKGTEAMTPQTVSQVTQTLRNELKEMRNTTAMGTADPSIAALQKEICEELEADPAFMAEIKQDFQNIAKKILVHRQNRLKP